MIEKRISVVTARKMLGVSAQHVRRLIKSGVLQGIEVSTPGAERKRYAVLEASVLAFATKRKVRRTEMDSDSKTAAVR